MRCGGRHRAAPCAALCRRARDCWRSPERWPSSASDSRRLAFSPVPAACNLATMRDNAGFAERAVRTRHDKGGRMFLIVGYVIILAAALGTYAVHGSLAALWVPLEYIAIVGLTIGGFVAVQRHQDHQDDDRRACRESSRARSLPRRFYVDLLAMLFEVLAKVRKEGLMSIENDVENPQDSPIFSKYPNIACQRPPCDGVHYRLSADDGRRQPQRHRDREA
jgi:hypothetical protein